MGKKNLIAIGVLFFVLLGTIFTTLFLISSSQDTRSGAQTPPDPFPTFPPVVTDIPVDVQDGDSSDPGPVDNVSVNHPDVEGDVVDYDFASCTWDSNLNAAQYHVKITEVDTETVLFDQLVDSGTLKERFGIVNGNTYRCEVAAVNASGVAGIAGVDEQVCEVEALAPSDTPSPTVPVATVAPTTPVASPTAVITTVPTLAPPGSVGTIATVGIGSVILLLIGGALLFL